MRINFCDNNEGFEQEESINKYKELFIDFIQNPPSLKESLVQLFTSAGLSNNKINNYSKEIESTSEKFVNDNWNKITGKYSSLKRDEAIIILTYTSEAIDSSYNPYKILNRNLVSKNRKERLK